MRRRDVAAGIAIGLGLLGFIVAFGSGTVHPIGNAIEKALFGGWAIGASLTVAAVVLHALHRWPRLERALGYIGVSWVTFIVSYDLLLGLLLVLAVLFGGGIGP